jgi:hypothetical protein
LAPALHVGYLCRMLLQYKDQWNIPLPPVLEGLEGIETQLNSMRKYLHMNSLALSCQRTCVAELLEPIYVSSVGSTRLYCLIL